MVCSHGAIGYECDLLWIWIGIHIAFTEIAQNRYGTHSCATSHIPLHCTQSKLHHVNSIINVHTSHRKRKRKQECIPVGCVLPACCPYLPACTAPRGCTWLGGVPAQGVYLPRYSLPPWTEFLTHATDNITLPQTSFAGGWNALCEQA